MFFFIIIIVTVIVIAIIIIIIINFDSIINCPYLNLWGFLPFPNSPPHPLGIEKSDRQLHGAWFLAGVNVYVNHLLWT